MSHPWWARFLVPNALFLGVAIGFGACCVGGFVASRQNPARHVERFHFYLCPETLFYPTVSQLCALAEGRLQDGKIAVIVGGDSRLHGTCQKASEQWTRKLQAFLGDEYEVFNFGIRCAATVEIGAIAAEVLSRRYPKVILVTDCPPGGMDNHPDGHRFRYFFWDAYYKHLLYPDEQRERRLREECTEVPREEQAQGKTSPFEGFYEEIKQRMRLDSVCYFTDLWNTVGLRHFFTVWTSSTIKAPTRPRRKYADPDPGALPLDVRYQGDLRELLKLVPPPPLCVQDARGAWVENGPLCQAFARSLHSCIAAPLRPRTVMVVLRQSSYFTERLSPEKQQALAEVCRTTVRVCEAAGLTALEAGADYLPEDYADMKHLSESGGAKLAADVAPKVRELARRLGYSRGEEGSCTGH